MTISATIELVDVSYPIVAAEVAVPISATTRVRDVWEEIHIEIEGAFFGREDLTDDHWSAIDDAIEHEISEAETSGRATKYVLEPVWLDGADTLAERIAFYDDFEAANGFEPETVYAYFNIVFDNE